jgi:SAM-dependent methyltransferase
MLDLNFAEREPPVAQLGAAAAALHDSAVAEFVLAKGMTQMQTGGSIWVPRMVLTAARRLGRSEEFLPMYEGFLTWLDAQSKADWHANFSDNAPADDLAAQSGRLGATAQHLEEEFRRITKTLEPRQNIRILDIGCAGGLWALQLAKLGFNVIGTDHHAGVIEAARRNARNAGLEGRLKFLVDDAANSCLEPADFSSRIMCICVTPCLKNDISFEALLSHLDKVSQPMGSKSHDRRIVLGSNRWAPSRMAAVRGILNNEPEDHCRMVSRLFLVECTWWMHPRHFESMKKRFASVTIVGETSHKLDGTRVDLLLQ